MKEDKFLYKVILFLVYYNISVIALYSQTTDNCSRASLLNKKSHSLKDVDRELSKKNAFASLEIATKFNCTEQKAEALKLLGILMTYEGELDSSFKYLQKSLSFFNSINNTRGVASCYLNMANIYQYKGDYNTSLVYYNKSAEKANEVNDKELISAAENNKGNVFYLQGFYKKAIEHYKKSLEIDKSLKDDDGVVSCLCNIGSVYDMLCDYTLALNYYYQALQLSKKVGNLYKQGKLYNNIGKVFLSTKNYSLAYDYLNTALVTRDEIGDKAGLIITLFNYAELYSALGLYKKEAEINQKALKLAEEIDDLQLVSVCLYNIGINLSKSQNNKTKTFFLESLKIAKSIEAYPEEYNNLIELIPIYYNEGNLKETQKHFNRLKYLHDSVLKVENLNRKNYIVKPKEYSFFNKSKIVYILITLFILIVISIIWFYKSKKNKINDKNN